MTELIIAVALWCGHPYNQSPISGTLPDRRFGSFKTPEQVQECRTTLLTCVGGKKSKQTQAECFK